MVKIVLDAGHGAKGNPYPTFSGYYEGTQMFKLVNFLKEELEKYGIVVVMTRKQVGDDPSLETRGNMAKGADMFISLHSDAYGSSGNASVQGVTVFSSLAQNNKPFGETIGVKIAKTMNTSFRGSTTRAGNGGLDYYGVLRAAASVGCKQAFLIEHGFHTNIANANFLIQDNNLKRLAVVEAEVIAEHFGLGIKTPKLVTPAKVVYKNKNIKAFVTDDGKSMAEVRELAEMLGLYVEWDGKTRTITLK